MKWSLSYFIPNFLSLFPSFPQFACWNQTETRFKMKQTKQFPTSALANIPSTPLLLERLIQKKEKCLQSVDISHSFNSIQTWLGTGKANAFEPKSASAEWKHLFALTHTHANAPIPYPFLSDAFEMCMLHANCVVTWIYFVNNTSFQFLWLFVWKIHLQNIEYFFISWFDYVKRTKWAVWRRRRGALPVHVHCAVHIPICKTSLCGNYCLMFMKEDAGE